MGFWTLVPILIAVSVGAAIFARPLGEFHQSQIDIWPEPLRFAQGLGIQYDDPVVIQYFRIGYILLAVGLSALLVTHLTGH